MKKVRESNFELMRIISILLIITGHTFSWGGIIDVSSTHVSMLIRFIYAIMIVHVNSFILVSGYFQAESKIRIKKIVELLLIMWFYKATLTFVGYKLGWFELNSFNLFWNISPFDFTNYWFLRYYIILYCLSPFINKALGSMNRIQIKKLLIILFVFASLLITLSNQELFNNSRGFSLVHFVFIYIIGYYIRKFNIIAEFINKWTMKKARNIILTVFISCFLLNYGLYRLGYIMTTETDIIGFNFFGNRILANFIAYDNPLVVIGSVAYFMLFATFSFKNRIVNFLASSVLEIYILHETAIFRSTLYSWFNIVGPYYSCSLVLRKAGFIILCIFVGASLIALIRKYLCKLIYHILNKLRLFKSIIDKINNLYTRIDNWINI